MVAVDCVLSRIASQLFALVACVWNWYRRVKNFLKGINLAQNSESIDTFFVYV